MKASILDLRRKMGDVLRSLERGERVTILHRGKEKGILIPATEKKSVSVRSHAAFGMWAERDDLSDVAAYVRSLRQRRF
jgi:prevent-host-death family protein